MDDTTSPVDDAPTGFTWQRGVALFVVLCLTAFWVWAFSPGAPSDKADGKSDKSATWDGKEPFKCGGNDKLTISGVSAKFDKGTAVTASNFTSSVPIATRAADTAWSSASITSTVGSTPRTAAVMPAAR